MKTAEEFYKQYFDIDIPTEQLCFHGQDMIEFAEYYHKQMVGKTPHYFSPSEENDRFCSICGKYLTDNCHIRAEQEEE